MDLIVCGVGWAGSRHALAAQEIARSGEDVRVVALVDPDAQHLAAQLEAVGVESGYADLEAALAAHPDAAGVVVASPHHLHRPHGEQAAAAGCHVLVEKPMTLTLEDADAMIEACEAAGVTCMVAESARYERPLTDLRDVLAAGRIGELLYARISHISGGHHTYAYPGRRAWLADPAVCGGGIWMLNGIHVASATRMLMGEVGRIYARTVASSAFESELEGTVASELEFVSGAVGHVTVSAELHGYHRFGDIVIFGSEGTAECNWRYSREVRVFTGGDEPDVIDCGEPRPPGGAPAGFVRQMREFLDAVRTGRAPYTAAASERRSLELVLAGYESARTGEPVEVSE